MKASVIIVLLWISLPSLLTAQVRPSVQVKKGEIPKQAANTKVRQLAPLVNEKQGQKNIFVVKPVEILRAEISRFAPLLTPSQPQTQPGPSAITNAGNSKYRTGNGVVLDALNPFDPVTGSLIQNRNVLYTKDIAAAIKNNVIPTLEQTVNYSDSQPPIWALFRDISTTPHTYLLTIGLYIGVNAQGVNLTTDKTRVTIFHEMGNPRIFENSALIYNEATSEIRVLFTEFSYHETMGIATSGLFDIIVRVTFDPGIGGFDFHHIQLVQLD